ncbi:MAG TPA: hypothetical protein VHO69_15985 [Phototrophicaceae bacterium]|nr:hypothetical protein [Phototrophicaceae bacterium]
MPSVWEEIYGSAQYHSVSAEKSIGSDREDLTVAQLLRLLALGVDASALEEVFGVWETTSVRRRK